LNIYVTAGDQFSCFGNFFAGHNFQYLPENYDAKLDVDLLLFPGGADVHPKRYGSRIPDESVYDKWIDENRDEWEFKVMQDISRGSLKPRKVLGVCRGMQFLNVALGGSLTYDIARRYGKPHPNVHAVDWIVPNVFSSVSYVNSLHHQSIYSKGNNLNPIMLGIEPNSEIVEAILWGDRYLGMQFHPELWKNETEMRVFSDGILDWIRGKNRILTGERPVETPKRRKPNTIDKAFEYKTTWNPPTVNVSIEEQEAALKAFLSTQEPPTPVFADANAWLPPTDEEDDDENDHEEEHEEEEDW